MANDNRAQLHVYFNDGSTQSIDFEPRDVEPTALASHMEKMLSSDRLVIQFEDRLQIIPVSSIRYLEVMPLPAMAPAVAILNARMLD